MSARRLGRLLGPALALAALFGAIFVADEPVAFTQMTFDWGLSVGTAVWHVSGSGV
ncbi:hypothetical protein OG792_02905 [Micromonospora sp. NBC_01699]|uniref:hypothetical protein n=1 Tax=Micromonospora sp. NBC_01699 TaxID=2975984 RepID=UPI002E2AACCC|nr:hypothetical protein [Micromonospora sp. NBC_01699]